MVHVLAPASTTANSTCDNDVTVWRFRYFPARWQKLAYGSGILPNLRRNPLLWLQVPFFVLAMSIALLRLLIKVRPHLIHAHWVLPQGLIAVLTGFLMRIPAVVSIHGADAFALRRGPLSLLKRLCLKCSAAWTANTHATAEAITCGHSLPPPHIIPMGVDTERFGSGSRDYLRIDIGSNEIIILYVGRLVEKKGVDDLIKAYALLPAELREKTYVWIIGRGDCETQLRALSVELEVDNHIRFWGEVPNDQLPDYYAAADLFVGPSVEAASGDTEGQGVVFIEAFAAGLCVIATRVGGIPEVVNDGQTGNLVPPRSPTELAAAIQRLLSDNTLREQLARNARETASRRYAWPRIAAEFADLYRQVISKS